MTTENLRLNAKYNILLEANKKANNVLRLISTHVPHLVFEISKEKILFLRKTGHFYYIEINSYTGKDSCLVCGKEKQTTAHHIIPLRANCFHPILKELRIRICKECGLKVHPENALLQKDILKRKDNLITELKSKLGVKDETKSKLY